VDNDRDGYDRNCGEECWEKELHGEFEL